MNETPFPLPREVDKARMTPLIKLEPLGLMLKKPLRLTIPYSALIPEQESFDVIVFSDRCLLKQRNIQITLHGPRKGHCQRS
ncbi:hypothetical protein HOLleu_36489 [Holothuria leucospilota]|uniref:Uncharacterized protein n=1 Tax=Holothuria leucospilota TaxID=206669 RepID=A0A9Q1BEQ8_HOLLE|nr:hypothetical protein HOLleu_36489 [Holothuria leucospilota]